MQRFSKTVVMNRVVFAVCVLVGFAWPVDGDLVGVSGNARVNFLKAAKEGKLAFPGLCVTENSSEARNWSENGQTIGEKDYLAYLHNHSLSAIKVSLTILQIFELFRVNEKKNTLDLSISIDKVWQECREIVSGSDDDIIVMKPSTFIQLGVFEPQLTIKEVSKPNLDDINVVEAVWDITGYLSLLYRFRLSLYCKIDVDMYPFDVHVCNLTFVSRYDSNQIEFEQILHFCSEKLMRSYVPNDKWALALLHPKKVTNLTVQYRFVLRRNTFEHLPDTVLPLFIMVMICSVAYWLPISSKSKTGLNLAVVLLLFVFYELTYDRIPKTSHGSSLMGRYLQACVGMAMASCIYAIISSLTFSPARPLQLALADPRCLHLRNFLSCLAPCMLAGVISQTQANSSVAADTSNATNVTVQFSSRNAVAVNDSDSNSNSHRDRDGNALLKSTSDCAVQVANEEGNYKANACNSTLQAPLSSAVGALVDRLFSVLLALCNIIVLCVFLSKGYAVWYGYGGLRDRLTAEDMITLCRQLKIQGAYYDDLPCDGQMTDLFKNYVYDLEHGEVCAADLQSYIQSYTERTDEDY